MLYLVRHGQTEANAGGLLQGRRDLPLTDDGHGQARALARALPPGVARVVCSPLRRARDTAALLGPPVEIDERWIEMDYGSWEGRPVQAVRDELRHRRETDPGWAPPGGESLLAVGDRVRRACDDLLEGVRHGDVAVVTHVSPIKAAVAWALGVPDVVASRLFVDVASVSVVAVSDHGPLLVTFNQTGHLRQPGGEGGALRPPGPGTGGRAGSAG